MIAIETQAANILDRGLESAEMQWMMLLGFETIAERNGPNIGCSSGKAMSDRLHARAAIPIYEAFSGLRNLSMIEPANPAPHCDFWRLSTQGRALFEEIIAQMSDEDIKTVKREYAPLMPKQPRVSSGSIDVQAARRAKLASIVPAANPDATDEHDDIEIEELPSEVEATAKSKGSRRKNATE